MKTGLLFLVIFTSVSSLSAQHYGGIYFSPNWNSSTINSSGYDVSGNYKTSLDYTFGYSIGYQGLMLGDRRFSFSYGLQYAHQYLPSYNPSNLLTKYDPDQNAIGIKKTTHSLEVPLSWRYNILKNKKLQPYISAGLTFRMPFKTSFDLLNSDGSEEGIPYQKNDPFSIFADFGIGLNYKVNENLMISVQPTIRPWKDDGKIGIGFSIMKKF